MLDENLEATEDNAKTKQVEIGEYKVTMGTDSMGSNPIEVVDPSDAFKAGTDWGGNGTTYVSGMDPIGANTSSFSGYYFGTPRFFREEDKKVEEPYKAILRNADLLQYTDSFPQNRKENIYPLLGSSIEGDKLLNLSTYLVVSGKDKPTIGVYIEKAYPVGGRDLNGILSNYREFILSIEGALDMQAFENIERYTKEGYAGGIYEHIKEWDTLETNEAHHQRVEGERKREEFDNELL